MRVALAFVFTTLFAANALAAELVMVEEKWCEWCERWNEEVGIVYDKTPEGTRAPLRRVDIHDRMPEDIEFRYGLHFTPTFVLVEDGREIGRIEGYPGEHFFWAMLSRLLEQLEAGD